MVAGPEAGWVAEGSKATVGAAAVAGEVVGVEPLAADNQE